MKSMFLRHWAMAGLIVSLLTVPVSAATLVDQINPYANKIGPGGGDWDTAFTNALAAQPGGYTIGSIANAAEVAAATSILVVYRNPFGGPNTLSIPEVQNLMNFLASGKRVVVIGEGNFFDVWNQSIVDFANAYADGTPATLGTPDSGTANPVVSNELTDGVGPINLQGGGIVSGGEGTALFDKNFATLWGANLLTVLDAQVFRNLAPAGSSDAIFRDNVVAWLADPDAAAGETPLPAAWPMLAGGLAGFGYLVRRSRRKMRTV